jgi:hypothetical protein
LAKATEARVLLLLGIVLAEATESTESRHCHCCQWVDELSDKAGKVQESLKLPPGIATRRRASKFWLSRSKECDGGKHNRLVEK